MTIAENREAPDQIVVAIPIDPDPTRFARLTVKHIADFPRDNWTEVPNGGIDRVAGNNGIPSEIP